MVSQIATIKLDPVARRLLEAGSPQSSSMLQWLEGQQQRSAMRRRATVCAVGGWLLMSVAAVVSSLVALHISHDIREIFLAEMPGESDVPRRVVFLPWVLVFVAVFLVVGGVIGWLAERIPGFSKTVSAIDWSTASDAVTRLLAAGCTYPEAFRMAAQVACSRPSRTWLMGAAERVESGGPQVVAAAESGGDAAVLELLIDAAESQPQRQWKVAADHFLEIASRRLVLLLQSTPMIATVISGLLLWIAISATLGWMWVAVAEMCRGLNY